VPFFRTAPMNVSPPEQIILAARQAGRYPPILAVFKPNAQSRILRMTAQGKPAAAG
jgi:hypothetical protein